MTGKGPTPSEDERRAFLRDVTSVGPQKPVGYLPLYTIRDFVRLSPKAVAAEARARGLTTAQFSPEQSCIKSGALYVYHRDALTALLQSHAATVTGAGLSLDPDSFVSCIAADWVDHDNPLHVVIRAAFGETL